MYAARGGHLPVVKVLLEHGADVFHKAEVSHTQRWYVHTYPQSNTALHLCANHVHRIQSLPFTLLPMVDPLNVSST